MVGELIDAQRSSMVGKDVLVQVVNSYMLRPGPININDHTGKVVSVDEQSLNLERENFEFAGPYHSIGLIMDNDTHQVLYRNSAAFKAYHYDVPLTPNVSDQVRSQGVFF